ncbi:MAG: DJ-1/PfpI family protein, partial [Monoglobaceae bacterium]
MLYILLAEGFEEVEAIAPLDIVRRAGIEIMTAGVGGDVICGAHGISVECDTVIETILPEDVEGIILPGGMPGT